MRRTIGAYNENEKAKKISSHALLQGKFSTEKLFCQKYASGTQKYSSIRAFFYSMVGNFFFGGYCSSSNHWHAKSHGLECNLSR